MNVRNKTKTFTQYQVDRILEKAEKDYEAQWNEQLDKIRTETFEQVKLDMFSQFMSVAMATLGQCNGFTTEETTKFYNDFIGLLNLMQSKPLGKDVTTQDAIDHVKDDNGIDLDKDLKDKIK